LLLEDVPGDDSNDDLGDGLESITIENTTGSLGGRVELNPVDGSYTYFSPGGGVERDDKFNYTITDLDDESSSTLTITVTIDQPDPPIAEAGLNQPQTGQPPIIVGQRVTLDGNESRDAAGNSVTGYAWSFTQRPPNATIELVEPNTATPSFTPTVPGEYILSLTVTDAQGLPSVADTVTITVVLIDPPTANAGPDQPETTGSPVIVDQIVTLDGSASRDAAGNPVTGYQWSFTQRPPNSTADLREANIAKPSFTPDTAGEYILSLTVTDAQDISSVADTVTISVAVDLEDCDVTTVRDLDTIEVKFDPDAPPKTGNVLEGNSCLGKNITLKITSSTVSGIGDNFTFNLDENGNYFILLPSMPVSPTAEKTYIIINNNKDINDDDRVSDTRTLSVKFIK
jgi:predicted secreted protein